MKNYCRYILLVFLLCTGANLFASVYNNGLYFRSHFTLSTERTSLILDENKPFEVENEFTISFQMWVRNNEPDFGSILHLYTNTNQLIRFSFVAGRRSHYPALVFNEGMVTIDSPIEREQWVSVSLQMNMNNNSIEVSYAGKDTTIMVPLRGTHQVRALFGYAPEYLADIAPINLRNVKIAQDGKQTREWRLWKHNDDICYDEIDGAISRAQFPNWLIDNHIEWKQIYRGTVPHRLDVAFNAADALFYLVKPNKVEVMDENGVITSEINVQGGYPAMEFTDHLIFDTLTNKLASYSLSQKRVSFFSFETNRWSSVERNKEEPSYYNHARTYNPADSSFYFFGGYGFYRYQNDLFRMNFIAEKMEVIQYEPLLNPRYSSAVAVVGDELYILGGRGNKHGKQELSSHFYTELCAIDLKRHKSRVVWKKEQTDAPMLMASSMYFEPEDSSFYAVSLENGGVLWKVSMNDTIWTAVSMPIHNNVIHQDCDFSFYSSPSHDKLFLVMDKIQIDRTHDVSIYSINTPLMSQADIMQPREEVSEDTWLWYWLSAWLLLISVAGFLYNKRSRSKKRKIMLENTTGVIREKIDESLSIMPEPVECYFDRSHSAISLLGTFNIRDKKGNDITSNFTPRLKSLLILLILYTEKNEKGILTRKVTEILWSDKDEVAARNNRYVTLSKLRVLLEDVGDVEVISEGGFLKMKWKENVFCDYCTAFRDMELFRRNGTQKDDVFLNQILELLLYGPLLSNIIVDWLDEFKDEYSSLSIDLLRNLLDIECRKNNHEMILRITDIMFLHDPLNEDALSAKCSVLFSEGKKGIAKSIYDRFCKEHKESLGEDYKIPLSKLCE
ncbi:hypothetical protein [Bacteroides sp. UBA939]|uniref:hypothetical protein n=1 Tax=Bacteroides sp. UBA939 TaxID=1946092 RepID=UPI0025BD9ADA|nr:hypothetical protein [Bacteroides sp. UBA939]